MFIPGSTLHKTIVTLQSNNNAYLIGNVCNNLTFSQTGFVISDSNCLYSIESYNMVSSFHINSKTIPTKKNAPDTPSPTARGSAGSGGQSKKEVYMVGMNTVDVYIWLRTCHHVPTFVRVRIISSWIPMR